MVLFWIKESFKLIGRAKSSFILSLLSMSISVMLIAASLLSIELSNHFQNNLKRNFSINIFLKENLSSGDLNNLQANLKESNYINTIKFISKEEAADKFIKETGEDFRKLLDYNPLPASYLITLKPAYVEKDSLKKIVKKFSALNGVDEVVYQQDFIYKLLDFLNRIQMYIFIVTGILVFVSIYIVFSTVKLITKSKYEELETMKLVGAKLSTIKIPIILNAMFIGFIAGLISVAVFSGFGYYLGKVIYLYKFLNLRNGFFVIAILLIGPVIGFIVSAFSLRKITLKI